MVGDVGVGKSSITARYVLNKFDTKMESTLGAAYMQKIYESTDGKPIKLKIWDTAGQEKYKAIAKLYYKDCQAAFIIFDVTRRQTFVNLAMWAEELIKHAPKNVCMTTIIQYWWSQEIKLTSFQLQLTKYPNHKQLEKRRLRHMLNL